MAEYMASFKSSSMEKFTFRNKSFNMSQELLKHFEDQVERGKCRPKNSQGTHTCSNLKIPDSLKVILSCRYACRVVKTILCVKTETLLFSLSVPLISSSLAMCRRQSTDGQHNQARHAWVTICHHQSLASSEKQRPKWNSFIRELCVLFLQK